MIEKSKLKIELNHWHYNCSDGCCSNYGTTTKINGEELDCQNEDAATIVEQILIHLGYEVEIDETHDNG